MTLITAEQARTPCSDLRRLALQCTRGDRMSGLDIHEINVPKLLILTH